MLELDLIFSRFIDRQLDALSDSQIIAFEKLLKADDPELYTWLMGYANPMDKELVDIVTFIRLNHHA